MIIFRRKNQSSKLGFGALHPVVEAQSKEQGDEVEYDYSTVEGIRNAWMAGVIDDNTAVADLVDIWIPEATAREFVRQWAREGLRTGVAMTHTAVPFEQIDKEEEGTPTITKDAVVIPTGCMILLSEAAYDTPDAGLTRATTWKTEYEAENPGFQVTEWGGTPSPKEEGKFVGYLIVCPLAPPPAEEKTSYWPWIAGGLGLLALGGIMIYATSGKK